MRQTAVFAGIFLFGASAFAADPQLMNLVMPDAQVMAGVNVTTAGISALGQFVLTQMGSKDAGLQEFISATGFDPRHDVSEILVASAGAVAPGNGLLLAKGTFDIGKITSLIGSAKGQQISTYAGATLISATDAKVSHGIAFIGSNIAVAGDLVSVKGALDRAATSNSVNPALAALVQSLSTTEDAWSVSMASIGSLIPSVGTPQTQGAATQTLQLVKNIQSSSGGIKFGTNVELKAQAIADTPQNATALADLFRMVTSLISMGAAQNPQAGAAAQLLQNLQITTSGTSVNIAASIPEAQIEALLSTATVKQTTPVPAARRRL